MASLREKRHIEALGAIFAAKQGKVIEASGSEVVNWEGMALQPQ